MRDGVYALARHDGYGAVSRSPGYAAFRKMKDGEDTWGRY